MNKKSRNIILWIWIGTTSLLDLGIGIFSFPLIAYINYPNDGMAYYEDNAYTMPIPGIVFNQIMISLLVFLFGIVWSAIVLMSSERLLFFLKFPTPQNNKFSHFSLGLFKFALLTMTIAIFVGNANLIYDQMQGRAALDRQ
jgi:hypothetical protein